MEHHFVPFYYILIAVNSARNDENNLNLILNFYFRTNSVLVSSLYFRSVINKM